MDSREILPETDEILFVLDSASLDPALETGHRVLEKFLYYKHYNDFLYLQTPTDPDSDRLQAIPAYTVSPVNKDGATIEYSVDGRKWSHGYRPREDIIEGKLQRAGIDNFDTDAAQLIEIFDALSSQQSRRTEMLVTKNPMFLEHRRELEHQFRRHDHEQHPLNIATPEEAAELAGLYKRSNDDFVYFCSDDWADSHKTGLTTWCYALSHLFIQHFERNEYLGSMRDRFEALFIAIDELGKQYYAGTGNHTDIRTRYHFNYSISLLTGICDILALQTRDKYAIEIPDRKTNLRTGDHPLLPELRKENEEAWMCVMDHHHLIELLHLIRNDIIHRSGVIARGPGFTYSTEEATDWNAHNLNLNNLSDGQREQFRKYYEQLDDSREQYDPVTKWGVTVMDGHVTEITEHTIIEPYRFLKQATMAMAEFADRYLQELGYANMLAEIAEEESYPRREVEQILKYELFPLLHSLDHDAVPWDE